MSRPVTIAVTVAATATLVGGVLAAPAHAAPGPDTAAPKVSGVAISPTALVMSKGGGVTPWTFRGTVEDPKVKGQTTSGIKDLGGGKSAVYYVIESRAGAANGATGTATQQSGNERRGAWGGTGATAKGSAVAGLRQWRVGMYATDAAGNTSTRVYSAWTPVRRVVRLTANASEPIRAGSKVKVRGVLKRLKWDATGFQRYAGRTVIVQFRAKGTTAWVIKGTTTTRADGTYRKRFTAKVDGRWRAKVRATKAFTGKLSAGDYVNVY